MFENLYQSHNGKRMQSPHLPHDVEGQEEWHMPPAVVEELPPGLIADEI